MSRTVAVYGIGNRFQRRFASALAATDFQVEEGNGDPTYRTPIVVSYLDGEPDLLPELTVEALTARCIFISNRTIPDDAPHPKVILPEDVSAEVLLFYLCSLLPEAERRQDERFPARLRVQYRCRGTPAGQEAAMTESELSNLSLGGAFVRSLNPPPIGSPVQLTLELTDEVPPLALNGRVVYQVVADLERGIMHNPADPDRPLAAHPGFAVAFDGSSFETRSLLQRLLRELEDRSG